MKVLMINGSPHKDGCTNAALEIIAKSLQEDGVESEIVWIGKHIAGGCIACGKCKKTGKCVFDDVVNELLQKAETIDGLIVGSPVYYASPNGSLIAVMDRLFYAGSQMLVYKPAAAVVSARRAGTTASIDTLNKYFMINQMPIVSSRYWNMVHGNTPEEVMRDREGVQIMRRLGQDMSWLLKSIQAGKEKGITPMQQETPVFTNFIQTI